MGQQTFISFDNTENAFAYQSDQALKKAHFIFSTMQNACLVKLGTKLTPLAMRWGLPVKNIIRKTLFEQFVGGETLEETAPVVSRLGQYGVQVILDYGVEGKEGEADFEHACEEFIRVIRYAALQPNIPFMSVKVTGFARVGLLEKLNARQVLTGKEEEEWKQVKERMLRICQVAHECKVGVLVDAEESWIQDPIDQLTMQMMQRFNQDQAIVFNTIQLYRRDRLAFLQRSFEQAQEQGFLLGVKLVRGAYMEKERKRAKEQGYPSPIQASKEATDNDYNAALRFCVDHLDHIYLIVATHNEYSNLLTTQLLWERGFSMNHPHVHFSQLYGMSDHITFNLAKAGCKVSKYLPFGPIRDVIPYLIRRAEENSAVSGQSSRELVLICNELNRRKLSA